MPITHPFVSGIADGGDTTLVRPSDWDANHVIANFEEVLSADVTQTNANTYYDGPSHSCAAGTWLFIWKVLWLTSGTATHQNTARLWNGTTIYDESEAGSFNNSNNGWEIWVRGMAIVTLGSTTTVKISGASTGSGQVMQRDPSVNSGSSHTATKL